jgi:hypothetical protein
MSNPNSKGKDMQVSQLDATSLREKSKSRRISVSIEKSGWHCEFCEKTFVYEKSYLSHLCKQKIRNSEVQTVLGQAAFANYNVWMKARRFSEQSIGTFIKSKNYAAFIRFTEYAFKVKLNAPEFIRFIVSQHSDMMPSIWKNSELFSNYLIYRECKLNPFEQTCSSIEFITKICEKKEIDFKDYFIKVSFNEILNDVQLKKISPWFIFTSNMGNSFLNSLDRHDKRLFEKTIDRNAWYEIFVNKRPADFKELEEFCNNLF